MVNSPGVMKVYVDEYDNHAMGILQEDAQNGFDAYPQGTSPKNMKLEFKYDADNRILTYRDFDTSGMTHCTECDWGIRSDSTPCINDNCRWGCFHNLAYSSKDVASLGSRGMGKSLHMESGSRTIVNTSLPDGRNMASLWEIIDEDWKWKRYPEGAEELSSPGTKITTYDVKDNIHDDLINIEKVNLEFQMKWFRLLDQGATIVYVLIRNGNKVRKVIPKLTLPTIESHKVDKPTKLVKNKVVISLHRKRLGELRNLHLYLAKEPFNDEDKRCGIAIVKNGKQTIQIYRELPSDIPEKIRRRIFGYVDANCISKPFLNEAENSTHTGYRWSHLTYKAVRAELNKIIRSFCEPFIRETGERVTEKEQKEAAEILNLINQTLDSIPELQIFGLEGSGISGTPEINVKTVPYISRIDPSNERFDRGDKIEVKAIIKNPTSRDLILKTEFNLYDPTPVVISDRTSGILILKGSPEKPSTVEESWIIHVDDSMISGIYWIQVSLLDKDGEQIMNDNDKPEKKRASIFIEQDPPSIIRKARTGAGSQRTSGRTRGGEGKGGLAVLQAIKRPDLPDIEVIIETARAYAFYNLYGRRFRYLMDRSSRKTTPWLAVGEAIAEKLIEKKIEHDIDEGEDYWSAEAVLEKYKENEQLRLRFISRFMGLIE